MYSTTTTPKGPSDSKALGDEGATEEQALLEEIKNCDMRLQSRSSAGGQTPLSHRRGSEQLEEDDLRDDNASDFDGILGGEPAASETAAVDEEATSSVTGRDQAHGNGSSEGSFTHRPTSVSQPNGYASSAQLRKQRAESSSGDTASAIAPPQLTAKPPPPALSETTENGNGSRLLSPTNTGKVPLW